MKRSPATIAGIALLAALASCAQFDVRVARDSGTDFTRYQTWSWLPPELCEAADQRLPDRFLDRRLRATVDEELRAKGYEPAASGVPDLYLNYRLTTDEGSSLYVPRGYGLAPYARWDRAGIDSYEAGTLLLDTVDARTRTLVWRGSASARLLPHVSLERRVKRTEDVVRQILERFPPS